MLSPTSKLQALIAATLVVALLAIAQQPCSGRRAPRVVLWAWERPERLTFINPRAVAVAFLAKTIRLRETETIVKPRLQPLTFATGTELITVVRIEAERPALTPAQLEETASAIADVPQLNHLSTVQIDFDAKTSEREFYRALLHTLRQRLPAPIELSITALASWCLHDDWLTGLPINEAVPMLFRLGVERDEVRNYVASGREFRCRLCQNRLGVSTDEPLPPLPARRERRVYVFNPQPWSEAAVKRVLQEWP